MSEMIGSEMQSQKIKVGGGDLPNGFSILIPTAVDFSACTREELIDLAWMDIRGTLQRKWRKCSVSELQRMASSGMTLTVARVKENAPRGAVSFRAALLALGISDEEATVILNDTARLEQVLALLKSLGQDVSPNDDTDDIDDTDE